MDKRAIVILIVIFLLNPFLGMLVIILYKMITNKRERDSDFLLFAFITTYACLLQSTRIWNVNLPSDWNSLITIENFKNVGNTPFFKYLLLSGKEPIWNLLNYIGYYLTNGEIYLFLNGIAITTIILTCTSIYIYWKKIQANPITLILSLALIVFFTEYYGLLNNLLRQFFSLSIVSYVYVRKVTSNKTNWWLLIGACFIHTLSFIFLISFIIKPFYKKVDKRQFIKIGIIVVVIILILNYVSIIQKLFSNIDFLVYGFQRIQSASNPSDHNFLSVYVVELNATLLIIIGVIMNYISKPNRYTIFYTNILIVSMGLTIAIALVAPEIMGRIYVSRLYLFPFTLPYFMTRKKLFHNLYANGAVLFFFVRFLFTFDQIGDGFFFPHLNNIVTNTIFNFIL